MNISATKRTIVMLGTFGTRPKGTLRARALGIGAALAARGWTSQLVTTPWDYPADAGRRWHEDSVEVVNTRSVRPALWPLSVHQQLSEIRAAQPSLVHVFKPKGFGDLAARRLGGCLPIIVDMDDWEGDGGWNEAGLYGPLARRVFDWQERTLPPRAAAVTAASWLLAERAVQLGVDPSRVHYVPNGLTSARLKQLSRIPGAASGWRADELAGPGPNILIYTRFVEFDARSLARVLAEVLARQPDARLVIAGQSASGEPERALEAEARRLGVNEHIRRLGWINPADLSSLAVACDVAYHPFDDTIINRAKSSVKLLELMAAGIPIVTSRVGENAQFIRDRVDGRLVAPGRETEAIAALLELIERPGQARELGESAGRRVRSEYHWETLVDRVETAYDQALSRR